MLANIIVVDWQTLTARKGLEPHDVDGWVFRSFSFLIPATHEIQVFYGRDLIRKADSRALTQASLWVESYASSHCVTPNLPLYIISLHSYCKWVSRYLIACLNVKRLPPRNAIRRLHSLSHHCVDATTATTSPGSDPRLSHGLCNL